MRVREKFRAKLEAALEDQRHLTPDRRGEGDELWRGERERHRREVEAMAPIFAALEEIRQSAHVTYKKHGHDALTVEGLPIHVRITKTKAIYLFGDRSQVKRYLTLEDALDALIDHIAKAVAKRIAH